MLTGRFRRCKEWLAIASLAVVAAGIWCEALRPDSGTFRAVFLDVGQGDCVFLRTPSGRTMLVDGGGGQGQSDSDVMGLRVIEPFLRREGINCIDILVLTHPHDDHVQGLIPLLRDFRVGMVLDPGISYESECYGRFLSLVEARRIPYRRAVRGQVVDFGDGIRAEVLHPPTSGGLVATEDDVNNDSIVLRITSPGSSLLLAGDIGIEAEDDILRFRVHVRSDLLKVAHHGSGSSTSDEWLDAVRPRWAVISVGRNNSFGHPSREALERLAAHGVKAYRTDRDGAVVLEVGAGREEVRTLLSAGRP